MLEAFFLLGSHTLPWPHTPSILVGGGISIWAIAHWPGMLDVIDDLILQRGKMNYDLWIKQKRIQHAHDKCSEMLSQHD